MWRHEKKERNDRNVRVQSRNASLRRHYEVHDVRPDVRQPEAWIPTNPWEPLSRRKTIQTLADAWHVIENVLWDILSDVDFLKCSLLAISMSLYFTTSAKHELQHIFALKRLRNPRKRDLYNYLNIGPENIFPTAWCKSIQNCFVRLVNDAPCLWIVLST